MIFSSDEIVNKFIRNWENESEYIICDKNKSNLINWFISCRLRNIISFEFDEVIDIISWGIKASKGKPSKHGVSPKQHHQLVIQEFIFGFLKENLKKYLQTS
jgi:hypothetical protein